MFDALVSAALLLLIVGILTLLVHLTRTRYMVLQNQLVLSEIINEQRELRTQIQLTVNASRKISDQLYNIDGLIGRSKDEMIQVQKNLTRPLWEKPE